MAFDEKEMQIIEWGTKNGKSVQDIKNAVFRYRTTGSPAETDVKQQKTIGEDLAIGAAKGVGQIVKDTGDTVASGLPGMIAGPLGAIPGVREGISSGVQTAKDAIQGAAGLTPENLESQNTEQMVGKGGVIAASFVSPFVASRLAGLASRIPKVAAVSEGGFGGAIKRGVDAVTGFIKDPKLALAKQNVGPQLESSANRMFLEGTKRTQDPLTAYENYLTQSKKAITDIKADPAIASVGESIGDAFKQVVTNRRAVGKTMADELKKVADVKTDILPTVDTFVADLGQEGLVYDRVARKIVQEAGQTKMTADDLALLERYGVELQKLGSKPTVGELDAFMSRLPKEIDIYKSGKNITGSTNAERIIKKSLSDLREQFSPSINPAFETYYNARKEYAKLSDFIEEGSGFLGKLTQSGDFAKDASLAKSSVQSILNQGKKDWLNKLEELTGYPALDDSVLALQAMKDAGDFRGLSLLEELSKGAPTSAVGFSQKVIDYAMAKVGRVVGGTPEEQTRAFLKALKEGAEQESKGGNAAFGAATGVVPDEEGNIDPMNAALGLGLGAIGMKGGVSAKDIFKDNLIAALEKGAPKLNAALDTKLVQEADDLLQYLKEQKNPSWSFMNRALEVLRLQGVNVKPIADQVYRQAAGEFSQIRDALGRFTNEVR